MGNKGKMSHSPFHIESAQYKYAVENENNDITLKPKKIDCEYHSHTGHRCTKWNSGTQDCKAFKCLYHRKQKRENITCADCGFYMGNKCFYPSCPNGATISLTEASECGLFLGKKENASRYAQAQRLCLRVYLTEKIGISRRRIKDLKRTIKSLSSLMQAENASEADLMRWGALKEERLKELEQLQDKLVSYRTRQASLGEPLKAIPYTFVR